MRQFGICLEAIDFIKNPDLVDQILEVTREDIFDFVQVNLMTLPELYDDIYVITKEKMKRIRTVIHASFYLPPEYQGIDTGNKDAFENNFQYLKTSQKFADLLNADIIIVHPGIGGGEEHLNETICQLQKMNDPRIAIENLPHNPRGFQIHGSFFENIKRIIEETNCKFCFDFAHAVCAANSLKRNIYDDFEEYNAFNPDLYHLSDGNSLAIFDEHLHLGLGNYDIKKFLKNFTNENSMIVLETRKSVPKIDYWIKDMEYIKNLKLT